MKPNKVFLEPSERADFSVTVTNGDLNGQRGHKFKVFWSNDFHAGFHFFTTEIDDSIEISDEVEQVDLVSESGKVRQLDFRYHLSREKFQIGQSSPCCYIFYVLSVFLFI